MKKYLLLFLFLSSTAFAISTEAPKYRLLEKKGFDFIAPAVSGVSTLPESTGLIVFDDNQQQFFGKTSTPGSIGWVQLSPPSGSGFVPVGTILPYSGTSAPTGFLLCNGSNISRTTYSALFAIVSTSYGSGDGSTTFALPDLRGKFMRGIDGGAGNDPDASSRTTCASGGNSGDNIGSCQADEIASHTHDLNSALTNASGSSTVGAGSNVLVSNASTTATGGNEIRPKNVYVNYIIKY
ncbi:MAG: tail fiber protein [Oligoflexia bacterium]|nr:tail fiber protein [Oligoflexia bacterium]